MPRYDAKRIEAKWQQFWEQHATFRTPDPTGHDDPARKLYVLDMFPYPSGEGLHVGHPEGYTATDIVCRYQRMRGKHVLHPMGWDAFGLPAEQHAVKTGTHPWITTYRNIDTFRRQLKMLGFSYDWSRELATTDPEYYRWTQWIFLQIFDTWYDAECEWTGPDGRKRTGKGRPIAELPIPDDVRAAGDEAVRRYQDRHRLAYQQEAPVNWCEDLGTVLANEEVIDGKSERGGYPVKRIPLRQWMLRITAYADRLLEDLEPLDWSEGIKALQKNWIGRSTGAEVDFYIGDSSIRGENSAAFENWKTSRDKTGFSVEPGDDVLRVYTTRPDTLFGATYMVLAPEHPYVDRLTTPEQADAVDAYREQAALKSDLDRTDLAKEKTGVFTGSYAVNPVNGERIPIWIADYVLISYGTGAIMAVPAHDERDFEFAVSHDLPIRCVVLPSGEWLDMLLDRGMITPAMLQPIGGDLRFAAMNVEPEGEGDSDEEEDSELDQEIANELNAVADWITGDFDRDDVCGSQFINVFGLFPKLFGHAFAGEGAVVNSDEYDGLLSEEAKPKIIAELAENGLGRGAVNYRLRDWLFSRQHFWGEPFPIWHELDADGGMTGLLRTDPEDALPITLPENFEFQREHGSPEPPLSYAPQEWLYTTAQDGTRLKRETNSMPQWAGSCWYYLRFCDPENNEQFIDPEKEKYWMPVDLYIGGAEHAVLHLLYARFWHKVLFDRGHVTTPEPFQRLVNQGMILGANNEKMSKSRGNVVNPDDVVRDYGADSLRMYEMFMGPLEATKPWSMEGVNGVRKFLERVWRMITDERADDVQLNPAVQDVEPTAEQLRVLHRTIKVVTDDLNRLQFNTAISRMMEFTNAIGTQDPRPKSILEPFVLLLSPFAPHVCEELWQLLGHTDTLAYEPWPSYDDAHIAEAEVEVPVQINGKVRARIKVPADADQAAIQHLAETDETVAKHLAGKAIVKAVIVPGRLVNFVVKG